MVADTQIVNYLLTTTLIYTIAGFAIQSPDWTTRFVMLRRFAFIMGFIYVFRGITLLVTTLPSSLIDECRPPEIELTGSVGERFGFILSVIGGTALTCTDNIFSGHTSMMVSCCMLWRVHSRLRRPFSWILYLIATAGILMILFTRFHYSIDVVLAICKFTKKLKFCYTPALTSFFCSRNRYYLYSLGHLFKLCTRSIYAIHVWFHKPFYNGFIHFSLHRQWWRRTHVWILELATSSTG